MDEKDTFKDTFGDILNDQSKDDRFPKEDKDDLEGSLHPGELDDELF